jgi:hypothetical protein
LPFDAAGVIRARNDEERAVILPKDAKRCRSKYLEAAAASDDDEIDVEVGGLERRDSAVALATNTLSG